MTARPLAALLSMLMIVHMPAAAQQPGSGATVFPVTPVVLDNRGLFQARYTQVGDDLFVAGQPTERGLREMKRLGVTTVINLRTPEEMRHVAFDEPALVAELGMKYVYIPMRGNDRYPYSPEALAAFTEALSAADGKVLLHCTVAWRTSHLWAAYLIQERGVAVDAALEHARAINLMDDHRTGANDRQPVEDFLNRTLPEVRRRR